MPEWIPWKGWCARNPSTASFARYGKLKLAAKPEHFDKLARSQALLAANVDADTRLVSRAELRDELGSDRYYGALLTKECRHACRTLCARPGPRRPATRRDLPRTHARAGPEGAGGGYQVQTPAGSLRAGQVLLASGISQVGPFGWIRRRIVPVVLS
jgi:glycine/D-amino acid oxidase-like deaminating enzyme